MGLAGEILLGICKINEQKISKIVASHLIFFYPFSDFLHDNAFLKQFSSKSHFLQLEYSTVCFLQLDSSFVI